MEDAIQCAGMTCLLRQTLHGIPSLRHHLLCFVPLGACPNPAKLMVSAGRCPAYHYGDGVAARRATHAKAARSTTQVCVSAPSHRNHCTPMMLNGAVLTYSVLYLLVLCHLPAACPHLCGSPPCHQRTGQPSAALEVFATTAVGRSTVTTCWTRGNSATNSTRQCRYLGPFEAPRALLKSAHTCHD
jgi:hypothetical protein